MTGFGDFLEAFEFVSAGRQFEHSAYVSRVTGETFLRSEAADIDELPEGGEEDPDLVEIPHKRDLDLGRSLVFDFAEAHGVEVARAVRDIFRRKGAYSRFKNFLDRRGLLDRWYEFEARETKNRLLGWCRAKSLNVEE